MEEQRVTYPGEMLVANLSEMASGSGTYTYLGKIYASVKGVVEIHQKGSWHNQSQQDVITVLTLADESKDEADQILGNFDSTTPLIGQIVYGRVTKVQDRDCKLDILAVNDQPVGSVFVGTLQLENVRDFERDSVQMHNCFKPGDIVRAKVISSVGGGTSRDHGVMLKTSEDELGVVFAKSQQTGTLMVPRSWTEFECVQTRTKEKRKVAKVSS